MTSRSPPTSMKVNTTATRALSFTPTRRTPVRATMRMNAASRSGTGRMLPRYPANPSDTVADPIMPEKMISHPMTIATRFPTARAQYSYSAPTAGIMDESSM